MKHTQDNKDVFYFIGNITNHISHILPLYEKLGGTVVVTSTKALKEIKRYNVSVICIDDRPFKLMKPGWRPKFIHEYSIIDSSLRKTYDFLNKHARVVLFYELFDIQHPEWLSKPKKVFLHHGNGLKQYFDMTPKRKAIISNYDYVATLSPYTKSQLQALGVPQNKLIDLGVARTDDLIKLKHEEKNVRSGIVRQFSLNPRKKIILYAPTFWGDSSIYTTGLELLKHISSEYSVLFRPHPQTPNKILRKYKHLISTKPTIQLIDNKSIITSPISHLLVAADVIIVDLSSVVLEAILIEKPLVFAHETEDIGSRSHEYKPVKEIVKFSASVNQKTAKNINNIINLALLGGVDKKLWHTVQTRTWFHAKGDSVDSIVSFVEKL